MRIEENIGRIIALTVCVIFSWALIQSMWSGLRSLFRRAPDAPLDDWDAINRTLARPVQRPDGTWERGEIVWRTCDAPMAPNNLTVYGVDAPQQETRPRYSGVSHKSN